MAFQKINFDEFPKYKMKEKSKVFLQLMRSRRTIRDFSRRKFPIEIIHNVIKTAATAPSGANKQPWKFVIVEDLEIKSKFELRLKKKKKNSMPIEQQKNGWKI